MLNIEKFLDGIKLIAKTVLGSDAKGELEVLDSDGSLNYHNGTTRAKVVTDSHTATLTNKTIDANGTGNVISNLDTTDLAAGVLNVSASLASASDIQIPSALATKTYADTKVTGAGTVVDNKIVRYDGTTGLAIQSSAITIDDSGNLTNVSNLVASSADITALSVVTSLQESITVDSSTTGANATLAAPTPIVRLSNASLTSIDTVTSPLAGESITIVNQTGASIVINDNTGATAANRILTGLQSAITLRDEASITLKYDSTESRWIIVGASVSAAAGDLAIQTKTTTYTILNTDGLVLADATAGAFTVTLPTASGISGRIITVMKTDSSVNIVTIDGNASETINGSLTELLGSQYDSIRLVSNGTNWLIISSKVQVVAIYDTAAGQAVTHAARINFATKVRDTHNAVTTGASWVFTAPIAGTYNVSSKALPNTVSATVGQVFDIRLTKNGTSIRSGQQDVSENTTARLYSSVINSSVELAKGDTIYIIFNTDLPAVNLLASGIHNYITIAKVGI